MHCQLLIIILVYVVHQTLCGLINGDQGGNKNSIVQSVESNPTMFLLTKAKRGNDWEPQGNWKSKKDYTLQLRMKTVHANYILNCYKPKAHGNSKVALYFLYNELLEVDVTSCEEAKVWSAIRIQQPAKGYHHISVLLKSSCKEFQVHMETSHDNSSGPCQRNAGVADWEKVG